MIACRLQLVRTGFEREIHIEMLRTYAFDLSTTLACLALHNKSIGHEAFIGLLPLIEAGASDEDAFVICLKCFRAKRFWVLG